MLRPGRWARLLGIALTLGGCANAYPPELVPPVPSRDAAPEFYRPEPQTRYTIAVGDKLSISSYYHPDLKQTVTVQPDGQVPLLLIGSTVVVGKSPQELSVELTKGYSRYVENAEITVAVAESAALAVYVGGQVKSPSLVPISG